MTKEQIEQKAKNVYMRCFDDDFEYTDVLHALEICAEETATEATRELEAQIEKMQNCRNCKNEKIEGACGHFTQVGWCRDWKLAD